MADKSTAPSAELPPLPEPALVDQFSLEAAYTADQMHSHAASAVAAALQAVPAVPAGWKLVPVEPTREMRIAGAKAPAELLAPDGAAQVYRAMLAATPIAPAASINQCDGCQRGLPVNDWGHHRDESGAMGCTADRYAAPAPVLPAVDALALLSELVEDVSIGPGERLKRFDWERYAEHKPDCLPPRGDQGCRCGLNSVRCNLDKLLSACEGYEGRAPVDKARAALSRAGQADSEQPLGADSTGGANG